MACEAKPAALPAVAVALSSRGIATLMEIVGRIQMEQIFRKRKENLHALF